MNMNIAVNARTILEESVTCIAVKEDRRQNIMSSMALKKDVEEPWTIDSVVWFIDLLGYRGITLPAILAFRNRVADKCKAEVATEDAVEGDKPSNWLIESAVGEPVVEKDRRISTCMAALCRKTNTIVGGVNVARPVDVDFHGNYRALQVGPFSRPTNSIKRADALSVQGKVPTL